MIECKQHERDNTSTRQAAVWLSCAFGLCCLFISRDAVAQTCQNQTKSQTGSLYLNAHEVGGATAVKTGALNAREFALRSVDNHISVSASVSISDGEVSLFKGPSSVGSVEVGVRLRATVDGLPACNVYRKLARQEVWIPFVPGWFRQGVSVGDFVLTCSAAVKPGAQVLRVEVFAESRIDIAGDIEANSSLRGSLSSVSVSNCTGGWCTHSGANLFRGDFNGDGRQDLLCRDPGRLWIDYADASDRATGTTDWFIDTNWCTHSGATFHLGDFNGDGRTDLLCRDPGRLWIDYANTAGQFAGTDWYRDTSWCTHANTTFHVADFNGDGRSDLLCRDPGRLWLDYADTAGTFAGTNWYLDTVFCTHAGAKFHIGDFNGDGMTDLLCHDPGRLWVDYAATGGRFAPYDWYLDVNWCTATGATVSTGDVSNDGRADLICRNGGNLSTRRANQAGHLVVIN